MNRPAFIQPRAAEEFRRMSRGKTTRDRHNELVAAFSRMKVPEDFSPYDRPADTAAKLRQRARYAQALADIIAEQFEQMRDDAMQEGAKMEEFDSIRAAFNDFASGFSSRAEEIEEER